MAKKGIHFTLVEQVDVSRPLSPFTVKAWRVELRNEHFNLSERLAGIVQMKNIIVSKTESYHKHDKMENKGGACICD